MAHYLLLDRAFRHGLFERTWNLSRVPEPQTLGGNLDTPKITLYNKQIISLFGYRPNVREIFVAEEINLPGILNVPDFFREPHINGQHSFPRLCFDLDGLDVFRHSSGGPWASINFSATRTTRFGTPAEDYVIVGSLFTRRT